MEGSVDAPANFDISSVNTPSGKTGKVYCAKVYAEVGGKPKVHVGAAIEFVDLSEWITDTGDVVLLYDKKYFDGNGDAKIWLRGGWRFLPSANHRDR